MLCSCLHQTGSVLVSDLKFIRVVMKLSSFSYCCPYSEYLHCKYSGSRTERMSSFVDRLLQPIAQRQRSYIKDSTDFINFVERTKLRQDTILMSMDVMSLYTNIPHEEGITTVCRAYDAFHNNNPPIPTKHLREMLDLILKENSFQFNGENYLQTHGTAMGTKMAVAFANIFMADFETKLIRQSRIKPTEWKRYIDNVFSLWNKSKQDINLFIEQANQFHPSIKFTAKISENEITFLDAIIYKGDRFLTVSILDIKTHYKPTETFNTRILPPATLRV